MNVILCGLPMSGKSSVGRRLAELTSRPFIDLDKEIERCFKARHGETLTCREICRRHGEALFRTMESEQIALLPQHRGAVIALGGGSLADEHKAECAAAAGILIYLKACPEEIWRRTAVCGIPAYLDAADPKSDFLAVAAGRMRFLEMYAHVTIDTAHQSVDDIIKQAIGHLSHGKQLVRHHL